MQAWLDLRIGGTGADGALLAVLGDALAVDALEIRWPSGPREVYRGVVANPRLTIRESQ